MDQVLPEEATQGAFPFGVPSGSTQIFRKLTLLAWSCSTVGPGVSASGSPSKVGELRATSS